MLTLTACTAALAFWAVGKNNESLLQRVETHLQRYAAVEQAHAAEKRDALKTLVDDRDQIDRYDRLGVPLRLSFGLYHGAHLVPPLGRAIASYVPPAAPPAVITLDSMSLFDTGKASLKAGSTKRMVDAVEMIKAHPDKRVLVAGYADNVGSADFNLKLSNARAEAVRDWLAEASGIALTQFAIQGYGETRPIASNETDAGRTRNRRVEITLVPDAGT
ncbi:OmpA family protein [Pandoraea sp. NPDC090278]|uniref:OmpA family protein n=1 Tax=Pandoraea sp. NPDC090278 TaxID=3364391 RepID=UPI00383B393C